MDGRTTGGSHGTWPVGGLAGHVQVRGAAGGGGQEGISQLSCKDARSFPASAQPKKVANSAQRQ